MPPAAATDRAQVKTALQSVPLMFIENVGQFADDARFQVRGGDHTLWLAEDALWITVLEPSPVSHQPSAGSPDLPDSRSVRSPEWQIQNRDGVNVKLSFVGANPQPRLEPFDRLETSVNYFLGDDPARWRTDVPVWGGVRYVDLYPGVDLELTCDGWRLAVRNPQSAIHNVRLRVEGADALALDSGSVCLATAVGEHTMPLLEVVGVPAASLGSPTLTNDQVDSPFASPIRDARFAVRNLQFGTIRKSAIKWPALRHLPGRES